MSERINIIDLGNALRVVSKGLKRKG